MSSKPYAAGEVVEARCTKCRRVLNHTIVALVDRKIARVKCNTCNGEHNYHAVAAEKTGRAAQATKRATGAKEPKKDASQQDHEEWLALRPAMNQAEAVRYAMNGKFRVKDLINHPVFGLGVVKAIPAANKMEVLFQGGRKLLACRC